MKLKSATFLSIRGLPDIQCPFGDPMGPPADVMAITGAPASGKTRIIEAILAAKEVLAPYGPMVTGEPWLRAGESSAKIELTFVLDEEEQRMTGVKDRTVRAEALFGPRACRHEADEGFLSLLERYEHGPRYGKFEYFPDNRSLPPPGPPHGLQAVEQRMWRIGRDVRKYGFVPRLLNDLGQDAARAERFTNALHMLSPTVQYVGPTGGDPLRCFSSRGGGPSTCHELSSSEAHAVLIASTAALLHLERSIVFLDKPEISVDERNIVSFVSGVRNLAKDLQVIVATTSPTLVASLGPRAVVDLGGY
ncbi:MAG: ATP-binding protein [Polyangiaceae bacterium]|nr:ATP-binding protein [Polyangiaceae bacterium]